MRLSRHVGSWLARDLRIELHITPCVVMHPPPQCEALLNPANEQLVGTRFTPAECVRNLRGALRVAERRSAANVAAPMSGAATFAALRRLSLIHI